MPLASGQLFADILMNMSVLRYIIKARSKLGSYDLNKQAENFLKNILNLTYGYALVNLNEGKKNAAAIDLGDEDEGISYQITATSSSKKVHDTIAKFVSGKLYETYGRLVVFVLTEKSKLTASFDTQGKFNFSKVTDIVDMDDLFAEIEKLPLSSLKEVHAFVMAELVPINQSLAPKGSLLAIAEKAANSPPKTAKKFFEFLKVEDEDVAKEFAALKRFYKKLSNFSSGQREYIALIMERGKIVGNYDPPVLGIDPDEILRLLKSISRETAVSFYRNLEQENLMSYEADEYGAPLILRHLMECEKDFFLSVKKFCKTKENIHRAIVDGDFTFLDAGE
jgi:hypothetical protein